MARKRKKDDVGGLGYCRSAVVAAALLRSKGCEAEVGEGFIALAKKIREVSGAKPTANMSKSTAARTIAGFVQSDPDAVADARRGVVHRGRGAVIHGPEKSAGIVGWRAA